MIEVKAPNEVPTMFLAGSIESGIAEKWQARVVDYFESEDIIIYNPRRDDWDVSWNDTPYNEHLEEQILWEHQHLMGSDYVLFYFDENTKSPITLMELGMMLAFENKHRIIVCCPPKYWRYLNVKTFCDSNNIYWALDLDDALHEMMKLIDKKS